MLSKLGKLDILLDIFVKILKKLLTSWKIFLAKGKRNACEVVGL